jgi:hypothetical protein
MGTTAKLGATELANGVNGTTFANDAFLRVESALCLKALDMGLNTPPGSPAKGDTYILGASPTGAWASQANKIAVYNGTSWIFVTRDASMIAYVNDEKIRYAFDSNESLWYPLQPIWTTTEHWTGRYKDGSKIWSKSVDFGALPNATTKSVAHGVTGMIMSYLKAPTFEGSASNGTTAFPLHFILTTLQISDISIDATNINIGSGSNLSTLSAFIRIQYCKT